MAGLVEKDLRLLLQRKQIMGAFLALAVMLGYTTEGTFILGYLPILVLILTVSTISYDELDQGFTFLFTLPIDTKAYVTEKYIFCGIAGILSWIISIVIYSVSGIMRGESVDLLSEMPMLFSFLAIITFMMAFIIPIQIRFGANGSRMIIMVIFGVALILVFVLKKLLGEEKLVAMQHTFENISNTGFAIIVILGVVLSLIISYICSFRALKKKSL